MVVDYKVEDMESGEVTEGETSAIVGLKTFREEIEKRACGQEGRRFFCIGRPYTL